MIYVYIYKYMDLDDVCVVAILLFHVGFSSSKNQGHVDVRRSSHLVAE